MSLRVSSDPYGYKKLLVYSKAEELQRACAAFTAGFPRQKTLVALADQMDRSARSVKQNIVEGWKRNSTREYYDFLGFSIGANAELEEDCDDIIKGIYPSLRGEMGEKGWTLERVQKEPFYPLDARLPPLIQLKLRGKELNFLLTKLQDSLEGKMSAEHGLSLADKLNRAARTEHERDEWLRKEREKLEEKGEKVEKGKMGERG